MATTERMANIVVLGAGVVGLTTALTIQEKGLYSVTIIAETLPSDPKTVKYTSPWAGAYHVIYRGTDENEHNPAKYVPSDVGSIRIRGDAEGCFRRVKTLEYYYDKTDVDADWMPDFQVLPADSLIPDAKSGYSFDTYTIDPPLYLNYLLSRFLARGGAIVRGSVQHVKQIVEGGAGIFSHGHASESPAAVDALVVCPGLGARTLGGVEDKDVYPSRGQVVIVQAPWVTTAMRASDLFETVWTYVIPRRNGNVALGGTKVADDWYPVVRPETTEDILMRCLALCPELAPPEIRAQRAPTIEDVRPLIVEVGCGFRPARKGGIRLDVERIDDPQRGRTIPMVFNYGHGGNGYESSWGSASIALELLEGSLANP